MEMERQMGRMEPGNHAMVLVGRAHLVASERTPVQGNTRHTRDDGHPQVIISEANSCHGGGGKVQAHS